MKKYKRNSRENGNYSFMVGKKVKFPLLKMLVVVLILCLAGTMYYFQIPCPMKTLLGGIECPSCGMTRAVISCLKLDFMQAFSYNFMFWTIPFIGLYFFYDGQPFKNKILNAVILILIILGFLTLFFMRIVKYSL